MASLVKTSRRQQRRYPGKCGKRPDLQRDRQINALLRHYVYLKAHEGTDEEQRIQKTIDNALLKLQMSSDQFQEQHRSY